MNTPVSLKIKKRLYDKGWRYNLIFDEKEYRVKNSLAEQRWNEGELSYVDIIISDVVMWFYKQHGIWIKPHPFVKRDKESVWLYDIFKDNYIIEQLSPSLGVNSPIEAYEAGIEYSLKNLI